MGVGVIITGALVTLLVVSGVGMLVAVAVTAKDRMPRPEPVWVLSVDAAGECVINQRRY